MKPYENTLLYHHKECNTIITLYPLRSSSARLEIRILNVILYDILLCFTRSYIFLIFTDLILKSEMYMILYFS